MNDIFEKLIKSKIEQFKDDYLDLSRQIFVNKEGALIHPGEFGIYREKIIKDFLAPFLPTRLAIGTGFIITASNNISTQCDIIIYDKEYTPVIENGEQRFFPIESVVGVIEVKSKLTKSQLTKALKKLALIKNLRNDIENNSYIFKRYKDSSCFDAKNKVRDQMATFLICESVDVNTEELDTFFEKAYEGIDKSLFHNMLLDLNGGCFLYNDGNGAIYYPYIDYRDIPFKNMYILPQEVGYSEEHILIFLNYFYMLISSVSVMEIEITKYLGKIRKAKAIVEK